MIICEICNNGTGNRHFHVKEMLRGTREVFDYIECGVCGSVQIADAPKDMSQYYANSTYGSFTQRKRTYFGAKLRKSRNRFAILRRGWVFGALLNRLYPLPPDYCAIRDYASVTSAILDVGCGRGDYMLSLAEIGFTNVAGIDPFINENLIYPNGFLVRRLFIEQVPEHYDVIVSHHSFEHVPNPLETLLSFKEHLNIGGVCLLTVPVAEQLYREYKEHCYLLQAPQHFCLPSINGMAILAERANLRLEQIIRDGSNEATWQKNSELWKRGIAFSEVSRSVDAEFRPDELKRFRRRAEELVRQSRGDNVTFVLRNGGAACAE